VVNFISEEIKDLEIEKLGAITKADNERLIKFREELRRLEADSLLNTEQFKNQQLKVKEIKNLLSIKTQKNALSELDKIKQQQVSQLELEKLANLKKDERLLLDQKNNEILDYKIKEGEAFTKNLYYALFGLVLLAIMFGFFYINVKRKNTKIDRQRVIIAREKEKSEQLLLNIIPASIAEELKETGKSVPKYYKEVSVLFTGFAGFTQIAETLSPVELVNKLDEVFLEFDSIGERNGLNRIKTIGDAYMSAAGIPEENENHAQNAVQAAIEMRDFITEFNSNIDDSEPKWNMRIGVNTGPIVAGVVGQKKFAYDIWGDAVNIASRMESSGEIGKVNISESTHEIVKSKFSLEYRGKIKAKNKGSIDMYFADL
jgi:adenylate cyclase